MIRTGKYLPVILALFAVAWLACTQERSPCLTPRIASLNIECMHHQFDTSTVFVDSALPEAIFVPLTNTSNNAGTIYPKQSNFTISLSPDSTICQWLFTTDSTRTAFDTLTFYYERKLQFISNACGLTYFYVLDSLRTTHNNIDSAHIINTSVTNNVNTKHLQIFIHPAF